MSGREPTSAAFDPAPLAPRRRRVDPVAIGALVVVLGIAAAVLKPWDAPDAADDAAAIPAVTAGIEAPATIGPDATRPSRPPTAERPEPALSVPPITWPRAAAAVRPHDAWGVLAVVRVPRGDTTQSSDDPEAGFAERWTEVDVAPDGDERALLSTADLGVYAIGITHPPDDLPLDVRISMRTGDGWRWLDAPAIGASTAFGAYLFGPPRLDEVALQRWLPGTYRIDVLTGGGVRQIRAYLPNRYEDVPRTPEAPILSDQTLQGPYSPAFDALREPGPFLVEDGVARPLVVASAGPVDEASAWRVGGPSDYTRRGNGLGVLFPSGAAEAGATLHLVAPDEAPSDARRVFGLRLQGSDRSPYAIFRAPGGQPWSPGTYRIDATWTDALGPRAASWRITLRPGPGAEVAPALAAVRALAATDPAPGVWGIGDDGLPPRDLSCSDGDAASIDDPVPFIGVVHPLGAAPSAVSAALLLPGPRTAEQPVLVAPEAVPGITLLAPADAGAFVPGMYRLTLDDPSGPRVVTVCAGITVIE